MYLVYKFTKNHSGNLSFNTPYKKVPKRAPNRSHIFHLYTMKVLNNNKKGIRRNALFQKLATEGIQCSVHYTPLHLMTYYKQFLREKDVFPVAEKVYPKFVLPETTTSFTSH